MKAIRVISAALLLTACGTACHIDGDVLAGKGGGGNPPPPDYSYSYPVPSNDSSCPWPQGWHGAVTLTSSGASSCVNPAGSITGIQAGNDGTLRIHLKKLVDGGFPTVSVVSYIDIGNSADGYYWSDSSTSSLVQFVCFAGAASSDGATVESNCRPSGSARVSGISFSSHDHLLLFYKLVLLNPNCAAAESYVGSAPNKACPIGDAGTILDATGSAFPDLYMEGSS